MGFSLEIFVHGRTTLRCTLLPCMIIPCEIISWLKTNLGFLPGNIINNLKKSFLNSIFDGGKVFLYLQIPNRNVFTLKHALLVYDSY